MTIKRLLPQRLLLALALAACCAVATPSLVAQEMHPATPGETRTVAPENRTGPRSEGGAAAGGTEQGEPKKELLPDLKDPQTWWSALWVVIIFVILLAVLYPTAWKNVLAGLKKREQRIRQDIADAEAARAKAEQTLKEYNARLASAEGQIRDMLSKATTDAQQVADQIRTRTEQELIERRERAETDIERAKNDALAQIYEQAADLSTTIAEKILQRNLNADDQRELVTRSLDQLRAVGNRG